MGKFEKCFDDFASNNLLHMDEDSVKSARRMYYLGALELIGLFENISEENGEQETIEIANEVKSWCSEETDRILREIEDIRRSN